MTEVSERFKAYYLQEMYNRDMKRQKYPKIGLALGSGAAKGLAHIGVIKALEKHQIPIDFIAGSSMGALMGAHYAVFKDTNRLENMIFDFNRREGFKLFDPTLTGGLIKGKKFERFITQMLEAAKFEDVQIPFAAVATDFHTAESVIFTKGNLPKAIRASTSVPPFFQPIFYQDTLLADGGLSNPVPVDTVREMGAEIVIAVNLDTVYAGEIIPTPPALARIPMHSVNILRHNISLQSVKTADIICSPHGEYQIGLIGWEYFFNTEKAQSVIKAGEEAMEEQIEKLQELIAEKQKKSSGVERILSIFKKFIRQT